MFCRELSLVCLGYAVLQQMMSEYIARVGTFLLLYPVFMALCLSLECCFVLPQPVMPAAHLMTDLALVPAFAVVMLYQTCLER